METEEHVIGEVTECVVNNVQKRKPSEDNETEHKKQDTDVQNLQNGTRDQDQAEQNKEDTDLKSLTTHETQAEDKKQDDHNKGEHEEQNANAEDMQVESQEDKKEDDNMQKDSVKPKIRISPRSTNAGKAASKLVNKAKSKIKGSWHFVNKERAERAKATKCFVCGKQNNTLQELERHVRRKHKSYRYKCSYCRKKYLTRAGRNKHEMYHTVGYRFRCKECKKAFMFGGEYDEHMSVHTGDNRYICHKKGCNKDYGSTRARNYHERQHAAKPVYCDFRPNPKGKKCNEKFFSKQHLD